MSDNTSIEWTDATWNPITGCSVVSPGCTNCYAMKLAGTRLKHHPTRVGLTRDTKAGPVWTGEVRFNERQLLEPLGWKRPRTIFVCAHGDLFHPDVPDVWLDRVFAVMALCPHHTFQVLTKRPERMRAYLSEETVALRWEEPMQKMERDRGNYLQLSAHILPYRDGPWPLPNVWLGTSVEDQRRADERIPHLRETPAAVRFLSVEPLLGPVDIKKHLWPVHPSWPAIYRSPQEAIEAGAAVTYHRQALISTDWARSLVNWVIVGGESGPGARPMHPDWARALRDQCQTAGVPFFFKQWGNWTPGENVSRFSGTVRSATWWNDQWSYGSENLARDDGHVEDEPDLYELSKKAAGRLLDGVQHDAMPERRA